MPYYFYDTDVADMTVRQINRLFREKDESNLWPIRGRFNATERAIRRVRRNVLPHLGGTGGAEYAEILSNEISKIVNNSSNW